MPAAASASRSQVVCASPPTWRKRTPGGGCFTGPAADMWVRSHSRSTARSCSTSSSSSFLQPDTLQAPITSTAAQAAAPVGCGSPEAYLVE